MEGIFNMELKWPLDDSNWRVNTIPADQDFTAHVDEKICPFLGKVFDAIDADAKTISMMNDM
jgi:hypothetical protein